MRRERETRCDETDRAGRVKVRHQESGFEAVTLDLDRLLTGREGSMRANAMGVLMVVVHSAEGLPAADANFSSDPYVSISYSRYRKPLFATRIIQRTLKPVWQEVRLSSLHPLPRPI